MHGLLKGPKVCSSKTTLHYSRSLALKSICSSKHPLHPAKLKVCRGCCSRCSLPYDWLEQLEEVQAEHHKKEQLRHSLQVFLSVPISIAKDQPLLRPPVVDTSGALVHWGHTLVVVACFADHIVLPVGIGCSRQKDFGSWGRILLVVVYLEAICGTQEEEDPY